jgi:hypothetical protein
MTTACRPSSETKKDNNISITLGLFFIQFKALLSCFNLLCQGFVVDPALRGVSSVAIRSSSTACEVFVPVNVSGMMIRAMRNPHNISRF